MTSNPDIDEERARNTFPIREVSRLIYGSEKVLQERKAAVEFVESIPGFRDETPPEFLSRAERYENVARKDALLHFYRARFANMDIEQQYLIQRLALLGDNPTTGLHENMFIPTLISQASDEQQKKWLPLALSYGIMGTYAQTELGHGTQVKFLETTATFDVTAQEFVLHTPTMTATKWWPGNLGKTSNYAVVQAQLISGGHRHGPHIFFVQLRDLDTHQPLNGITLGDIGPKLGFHANDNGYLSFENYRIPRENMLMRFAKILPDGSYVRPPHAKLSYGGMLFVRSVMCVGQASWLASAATIAIRYSAVRRQGEITPGAGEVKILDYQTQQYRVVPELAKAFAFHFAGRRLRDFYLKVSKQLRGGDTTALPELHALSSGLKALITWEVAQGIEQCRLACGGHGYNLASNLPQLYGKAVAGSTYEGDNIVLLLQVARSMVKTVQSIRTGNSKKLSPVTSYLAKQVSARSLLHGGLDLQHLLQAFEHVARIQADDCVDRLESLKRRGYSSENAWNECSIQLCKAARAHTRTFIVHTFIETLNQIKMDSVRAVLTEVCRLFIYTAIERRTGQFLLAGFLSDEQLQWIREGTVNSLSTLRPNLVALTDSWDLSDRELHSVLGRYDGRVYENMIEWVNQSTLNKTDVLDSYHKYLGPMMKAARSKI